MNWLVLFFVLELGWMPNGDFDLYENPLGLDPKYSAYTELDAEVQLFGLLFVGGGIKTTVWHFRSYKFFPHKAVYNFRFGARYGLLELGFRHYCIHPVIPYFSNPHAIWEGAYEEVYLKISNK